MKKKAMEMAAVGEMILLVIVVAVVITVVIGNVRPAIASTGNIKTIQQWVWQNSLEEGKTKHLFSDASYPPIAEISEPIQVNSKNINTDDLKTELTESIFDCGKAFYFGDPKFDFMGKWDFANEGYIFCYPCREIKFDSSVKGDNSIVGLGSYMQTHSPYPGGKPTYGDILNDMNPNLFKGGISPKEDKITSNNDKYIVFVATHDIKPTIADCAFEYGVSEYVGGSAASVVADGVNLIGIGGRYKEVFFTESEDTYKTAILIADINKIQGICSPTIVKECIKKENNYESDQAMIGTAEGVSYTN